MNFKLEQLDKSTFKIDARIHRNGKPYRKRYTFSGSKRQANYKGAEMVRELEAKAENETFTGSLTSFKQCVQFYLSRNEIKRNDMTYINRLSEELGELSIDDISNGLQRFIQYLSRTRTRKGTFYSDATKNRYQQWTRAILNCAVKWDQIEKNPIKQIQKFKETPRDESLTPEEVKRLLSAIDEYRPYLKAITVFALQIPCRVSELTNAKRVDCDMNSLQLRIRSGTTKNGNGISKPIPPNLVQYFKELPIECPWIFYREANGEYHQLKNFNKAWRYVCEFAGLPELRFHDLRHVSATDLINKGLSERQLMEVAGWKTNMLSTYYHRNSSATTKAVQNILGGEVDPLKTMSM